MISLPTPLRLISLLLVVGILDSTVAGCRAETNAERPLPRTLSHHPGNIFLSGEAVTLSVPSKSVQRWSLTDVNGAVIASGEVAGEKIGLGKLGIGFYRVTWSPATEPVDTALAVLAPLTIPTPEKSPICAQTWLTGYYILGRISSFDDAANLVALAGVNGVRDAVAWTWLAADDGSWVDSGNRSAESLKLATDAYAKTGLKLLLMTEPATPPRFQVSADWGVRPRKKFPVDYRDYAAYVRRLIEKTGSTVEAYEAWNEPEGIGGGYIGSEIAAATKVFRLAARATNPSIHTAMGIGIPHAESLSRNGYLEAIDSYHFHAHKSPELSRQRRRNFDGLSGNLPVWVTESSYGSYPIADRKRGRLSAATEAQQAADIAKLYTRGLHDGNDRLYYFCLFDFTEESGQTWGVLMPETLEPRPAYVALAAAGRLLAGAVPLGALQSLPAGVEGWLLDCVIDGKKQKVVVAWTQGQTPIAWMPPATESAWDMWGRKLARPPESIGPEPLYLVLKSTATVAVTPPPTRAIQAGTKPLGISPVVADFRRPDRFKSRIGDFFLLTHLENVLDLDIYNFSSSELKGEWKVEATEGIVAQLPEAKQTLAAGARATLRLVVRGNASHADGRVRWIEVTGRFGDGVPSRLSLPVVFCPEELTPKSQCRVAVTSPTAVWRSITPAGTQATIATDTNATTVSIHLGEAPNKTVGTTWATAVCHLTKDELIPAGAKAVTLRLCAGSLPAGAQISLILIERSGAAYACTLPVEEKKMGSAEGQRFTLPFSLFVFQGYRKPYADEALNLDEIVSCEISVSALPHERTQLTVQELGWVLE